MLSPRLADLLETGQFDPEDPRHREAFLRAFAAGAFSPQPPQVPSVAVVRCG